MRTLMVAVVVGPIARHRNERGLATGQVHRSRRMPLRVLHVRRLDCEGRYCHPRHAR